jgi:hypothetical protein
MLSSRAALKKTLEHWKSESRASRPEAPTPDIEATSTGSLTEREAERQERSAISVTLHALRRQAPRVDALLDLIETLDSRGVPDSRGEALVAKLHELLDGDPREKVIIFTEYLDTLKFLEERLRQEDEFRGRMTRLTGGMGMRRRDNVMEEFAGSARVLLATDAASEGLNLQDHCHLMVHIELPWNPNRLEQRIGRIHRWGQERDCCIFNLYIPDSPESRVLQINVEKLERMRRDLGAVNDVLGALGEESVAVRLNRFGATYAEEEVQAAADELGGEQDSAAEAAQKQPDSLGRHQQFTAEDCRAWQPVLEAARAQAPSPDQIRLLVESEPVRGRLEPAREAEEGIYRLHVATAPYHRLYDPEKSVTFDPRLAAKRQNRGAELLSPRHPLVAALIRHHKSRLFRADGRSPRITTRVTSGAGEVGIVYVLRGVLRDQQGVLEEHLEPVWAPDSGPISTDRESDEDLLRSPELRVNVDQQKVRDHLREHHGRSVGPAQAEARRRLEERLQVRRDGRGRLQDELRQRVEEWAKAAADRVRAGESTESGQLALFEDPTRVDQEKRSVQRQLDEIERQRTEELERIEALGDVTMEDEIIPLAALVIIPEREAERWR